MGSAILGNLVGHLQLLIASVLGGGVLYLVYRRTSDNTLEEAEFASTIMVLAVSTAFIVTIVKESFAISIGLIGVLSIVRFRTTIKQPRQLLYIFIAVALGIGNGAGEYLLTALGTGCLVLLLYRFPVMPFDQQIPEPPAVIESAVSTNLNKIVAKVSGNSASGFGSTAFNISDISEHLALAKLPHKIKDAARTKNGITLTIHFFDNSLCEIDQSLRAMRALPAYKSLNLEFDIRSKPIASSSGAPEPMDDISNPITPNYTDNTAIIPGDYGTAIKDKIAVIAGSIDRVWSGGWMQSKARFARRPE